MVPKNDICAKLQDTGRQLKTEYHQLDQSKFPLKIAIYLLSFLYLYWCIFPKRDDFWRIVYNSLFFVQNPSQFFISGMKYIVYPPTIYAIEGYWTQLGAILYHIPIPDLKTHIFAYYYNGSSNVLYGILPYWGMLPLMLALFLFVALCYYVCKNKVLTLLCFGPLTFVSVILLGQLDIFCVLYIFISLILMKEAMSSDNYFYYILLSFLALGISMQFKTYGALLLPVYLLYTHTILKSRKLGIWSYLVTFLIAIESFLISMFIIWVPFGFSAFQSAILAGESNWLFSYQLPTGLSLWLVGYFFIFCYMYRFISQTDNRFLKDDRYFHFFNFGVVVWFFIAVPAYPQWWLLLLPVLILVMDNFSLQNNYLYCLGVCVFYWIYINSYVGFFATFSYYVGSLISLLSNINQNENLIALSLLIGILILWMYDLKVELDKNPELPITLPLT